MSQLELDVEALDITPVDRLAALQPDHRAYIETLASRKIKGFCGTIDENDAYYSEVYPGNASLTDSITADYHGRFLIELIQNANDVHPDTRSDGEIEILFDRSEGEHGTLYIANRGAAFSQKNVNALCDMGLSSKPPGESIGNKGLGFRSVHHISDTPLIYSQVDASIDPIRFEGYCFGFANDGDLDQLIADPRHRALAQRDLPLFHVPKWLVDQPEATRSFARRGFATVISLPLRDMSAADAVEKEITAIRNQTVPMLLFLARLERLTVRVVTVDGDPDKAFSLTRSEIPVAAAKVTLALVDLGNAGRFLVARRRVPETSMKAAIKDGTDKKQLHKHWLKWDGDGDVAIAARLNEVVATPRLFTFLPMGEQAAAPFAGYLHGSFFPTSNRKGLDASIKLNALLLDEATTLAAATISCLTQNEAIGLEHGLDSVAKACAVCDFLSWRGVDSLETNLDLAAQVAEKIAKQSGASTFDDASVIPCLGTGDGKPTIVWSAPSRARRWRYELETFSADVAAAYSANTQIAPIWPGLGPRIDRLNAYLTKHAKRYVEFPTAAERAELATRVASDLAANRRAPPARWAAYYKDLVVFLDKVGGTLAGRRLLLCADGKLHRAMAPVMEVEGKAKRRRRKGEIEASVFSPPARRGAGTDGEDQLTPPDSLAENFAFLSNRLDWYGELAPARLFLENAKLVFAFDREVVLAHLSRVLRQDGRNGVRAAGLRWAFQIWRQPRETGRAFKLQAQHRFFVPTIGGEFIEAGEAIFSEAWPEETQGRLLQRFLNSAPPDIGDLKRLSDRRLAPRSHYAFKGGKPELWVEFLVELGVQSGLRPVAKKVSSTVRAYRLENFSFCDDLGISPSAATAWKADIDTNKPGSARLPYDTDYVVRGDIWWMPGQGDLDQFSRECREYYAMLIIGWLGQTPLPSWTVEVHHYHFTNADTRDWPTPVAAFLRSAPWIPADEPSSEGTRRVSVKPSEIWLAPEGGAERFPSFLRRPAIPVMRALERATQDQIKTLRGRARLRVLNQTVTLVEQAEFLAQQYAKDGFDRYFERHFLNLYHRTWTLLADRVATGGFDLAGVTGPQMLVVRRGVDTEVVQLPSEDVKLTEPVYVRDDDDETVASLIEASGRLLFDPRAANPIRIGALLRKLYSKRVRLLSEADYSMVADGHEVGTGNVAPILSWCPRLRVLVAIAIEALRGTELQRLPADRYSIVAKLDRLVLQRVGTISFRIDGVDVAQEIDSRRAFSLKLPDGQPIVVLQSAGTVSWQVIEESLGAICEAIDQIALEPHLRLLIYALTNSGIPVGEAPPADLELEWLCGLLRLSETAKRSVRETLGARLERHVPWLRAIIHMGGGSEAIDAFAEQEAAAVQDIASLREILSPWLQALDLTADAVLESCKSALSIAELREALKLDFEMLNRSLIAVGEKPDIYPDLQSSLVANYVHENELAIIDALRAAHADRLVRNEPAPGYAEAREAVRSLAPDPEWLLRYKEVPAERIAEHVAAWLKANGATLGNNPHNLLPLDEVRRSNGLAIRKFATTANPLVKAWCGKASVAVPAIWREADGGMSALRAALDKVGIFDFRTLDDPSLIEWSIVVSAWPSQMPRSLDKADLGVIEADFDAERARARAEAEARKREARSIPFNGRKVDPEEVDWQALAAELGASLSKQMLSTPLGARAGLLPAKDRTDRPDRSGSSGSSGTPPPRAPSQKTDMIGRLGELAVYQWLGDRLPKQNIDAAWLSKNAFPFTGREGSDSLGYDFEVSFRNQLWQIEVKASLGDPCSFEIGETEVRAGRTAARSRSGVQYWVAYVSNLSEPAHARVEMLPNPLSEEGEAVLNLLGEGLRYGFRRS